MKTITLYEPNISATYSGKVPVDGSVSITPLCPLTDCVSCVVREELNGSYELEMVYIATGENANEIMRDRILGVFVPMQSSVYENYFRIYHVRKDITGRVYIYARHISSDMTYVPVMQNGQTKRSFTTLDAWSLRVREYAKSNFPFWLVDDGLSIPSGFRYSMPFNSPASALAYIGSEELNEPDKSALMIFGGELIWDQFTVRFTASRGVNRDYALTYGDNIEAINIEDDLDGVFTSFMLYYYDEDIQATSNVVSTSYASLFPYPRTMMVDWTFYLSGQDMTRAQIIAALNDAAVTYAANHEELGNPVRTIEVSMTAAAASEIYLGDMVPVTYVRHGEVINTRMKMVGYEWDVIMQRYNNISLGAIKQTLAKSIANTFSTNDLATATDNGLSVLTERLNRVEDNSLIFRGEFTGDLNQTDIRTGVYFISAWSNVTNGPSESLAYCNFVQFPKYNGQLLMSAGLMYFRQRTGSPAEWKAWRKVTVTTPS